MSCGVYHGGWWIWTFINAKAFVALTTVPFLFPNYGEPAKRMTKDDAEYFAKQLTALNSNEDVFDFEQFVDVNYEA